MSKVVTSVFGGNLGDTLWVTPLARYVGVDNLVVQMRASDKRARATAPILRGLAEVEWVENPPETLKAPICAHVTQQILSAYGYADKSSIPRVILTPEEIAWALDYLKAYPKPIAFINHNSGSGDPGNYRAHYVRPDPEIIRVLARFWGGPGHTILQFGPAPSYHNKDPFDPIPNAVQIRGLSVRQLAACYHVIGKMITGDTGDVHLGLAVGATIGCLVPPHSDILGYRHWDLLYDRVCWGGEKPRIRYALHEHWTKFMNTNLFSDLSVDKYSPNQL